MKTYICPICGTKKQLEKSDRTNPDSYCYCRPDVPSRLQELSSYKEMEKFGQSLKKAFKRF